MTYRSRPTHHRAAVIVLAVVLVSMTSCLRGVVAGRACSTSQWGEGGGWVMRCERGRWVRKATLADVARALRPKVGGRTLSGPPIRVVIAGDSTAGTIARAMARFQVMHPGDLEVLSLTMDGCPITIVASARNYAGERDQDVHNCALWTFDVPDKIAAFQPDVSVVFLAMMEQADHRESVDGPWRNVLEPGWAEYQLESFRRYATALHGSGAPVLWADVPIMRFLSRALPWVSDAPARTNALNAVFRRLDAERDDVTMIDFASRLNKPYGVIDTAVRPDGIHLSSAAADQVVVQWLVPLLDARRR